MPTTVEFFTLNIKDRNLKKQLKRYALNHGLRDYEATEEAIKQLIRRNQKHESQKEDQTQI